MFGSGTYPALAVSIVMERIEETMIGVFIFLIVSNLVFPLTARKLARHRVQEGLTCLQLGMGMSIQGMAMLLAKPPSAGQKDMEEEDEARGDPAPLLSRVDAILSSLPDLLLEADAEPSFWRGPPASILHSRYEELAAALSRGARAARIIRQCTLALVAEERLLAHMLVTSERGGPIRPRAPPSAGFSSAAATSAASAYTARAFQHGFPIPTPVMGPARRPQPDDHRYPQVEQPSHHHHGRRTLGDFAYTSEAAFDPLLLPGQASGLSLFGPIRPHLRQLQQRLDVVLELSCEALRLQQQQRQSGGRGAIGWIRRLCSARVPEDPAAEAAISTAQQLRAQHKTEEEEAERRSLMDGVAADAPTAALLRSVSIRRGPLAACAAALPLAVDALFRGLDEYIRVYEAFLHTHIGRTAAADASELRIGMLLPGHRLSNLDALSFNTFTFGICEAVGAAADVARLARRIVHAEARGSSVTVL